MKKLLSLVLIVLLVGTTIIGCSDSGTSTDGSTSSSGTDNVETPSGRAKDDIIFAQMSDIVSLDPHATNDSPSANLTRQIYSALVRTNVNMEYEGDLAETWEVLSPTEWQFNLRKGVKWHDGNDFTASDVKFSIERQQGSAQVKHLVEAIAEVEVVDPHTVIIRTHEPNGPLLANLAHSATRIVSEKAVTQYGDDYANNPIGTGPLKFVEAVSGDRVVLERFDDYFEGTPATAKLTMRVIPEGTSRTIALETGEIDFVSDVEPVDIDRIIASSELELYDVLSNRIEWLSINNEKEPFNNVLVRQALNYAINKDSVITVAENGRGTPVHTITGPTVLGYNGDINYYPYDPEKAKDLLAEAGYPDGFKTTLWASGDARLRAAQVIQADLLAVGIDASIENLEWAAYLEKTSAGEHDLHLLGWSNLTGDGDGGIYPNFHSSAQGSGNRTFYTNSAVDELLELGRTETDIEIRAQHYYDAQEIIMQEAAMVPLYVRPTSIAARKGLKGIELHPGSLHRYHMITY